MTSTQIRGTVGSVQPSVTTPPASPPRPPRRPRGRLIAVAVVAVLVGAGAATGIVLATGSHSSSLVPGGEPSAEARASASSRGPLQSSPAPPPPTQGPASEQHQWADGIAARIVSVTPAPADLPFTANDPANDLGLVVTVEFTNNGTAPLTWDSSTATPDWSLMYGANRYKAEGYADPDSQLPTRLMPGTTATWSTVNFLPHDQAGELALSVTPLWHDPAHPAWTFTGVHASS